VPGNFPSIRASRSVWQRALAELQGADEASAAPGPVGRAHARRARGRRESLDGSDEMGREPLWSAAAAAAWASRAALSTMRLMSRELALEDLPRRSAG
jgi:hypothetical protein